MKRTLVCLSFISLNVPFFFVDNGTYLTAPWESVQISGAAQAGAYDGRNEQVCISFGCLILDAIILQGIIVDLNYVEPRRFLLIAKFLGPGDFFQWDR